MSGYYDLTREFKVSPIKRDEIGRGLSLDRPVARLGGMNTIGGIDHIVDCMKVILSTKRGSRFFNPTFGSLLHTVLFNQNVIAKRQDAQFYAQEALERWEPRVRVVEVVAGDEQSLGKVSLNITFRVKGDSGLHEMPFDLVSEGIDNGVTL